MKKLSLIVFMVFFLMFTGLLSAQTQGGQWSTKAGDPGYTLDANNGERTTTVEIDFPKPYDVNPKVIVSVTQLDADKTFNSRYNVEVLSVSRDGFTVKVKTWADSKIFSISGYWLAFTD